MNYVILYELLELRKGKKPKRLTAYQDNESLPYVDIKAFETGIIEKYTDGEKCIKCDDGDLLIVCDGSRSGLIGKAVKGYVGSTLARIDCDLRVDKDYLFYFIQSKYMLLNSNVKGTGTPHLKQELLKSFRLYLPSIEQQKQIVKRIEKSLSQLDNAVETLNKTKQQLEIYRQAVLKEAFIGVLTESEFKNFSLLKNYIEKPKYGTSKKCSYSITTDSKPVYRIPNIDTDRMRINKQDIKYAVFSNDELENINLLDQDILIIRSNGSASLVGRAAILQKEDINATFAGYLMRLRIVNHNDLLPRFLLWYLQSHKARVYIESKAKSTSGVHNINSGEISSLQIPVFTIEEQKKIVDAVESRMLECDKIEQTINQSLQQSEALRQSILKQAFEEDL